MEQSEVERIDRIKEELEQSRNDLEVVGQIDRAKKELEQTRKDLDNLQDSCEYVYRKVAKLVGKDDSYTKYPGAIWLVMESVEMLADYLRDKKKNEG